MARTEDGRTPEVEPCCEPDYDYETGQYVHAEGCTRLDDDKEEA